MDEPFQGLDYGIRMEMVNMLLEIWKIKKPAFCLSPTKLMRR